MYKIGEFSKIVDVSVRTLRFYDQLGVLEPSNIDNFTGYRYYTDDDITECDLIKLLKSVGFTLEEIILYKSDLNKNILEQKQKEILEEINMLKKRYKRISDIKEEKVYSKIKKESEKEKILRRKYEKRNIKRNMECK